MIVSWNWLKEYVELPMTQEALENRLAMSGLNHEGTEKIGDDLAIDLEVTSNRADCLGHLGVAREIAVLWDAKLNIPNPAPLESSTSVDELKKISIEAEDLCYRYTARVIRGVKVGPSPQWMIDRLATLGIPTINNVVDITNYVLMESGQPLHAFDLAQLAGSEIIIRNAKKGEKFEAIDHKTYELEPGMCVIADSISAVALGGVMGGADTEVSKSTTNLLIESAEFAPLAIRGTSRRLNLYSPSSYRFERRVDPEAVDWSSRRCCELILELAGGELASGVIDIGRPQEERQGVVLRLSQLKRILGIEIPPEEVLRILTALGGQLVHGDNKSIEIIPPSWRRDLTREIDLVEEAVRIYGYDQVPEDVGVPMAPSHRTDNERVLDKVRRVVTSAGFDEAMTASMVGEAWSDAFSPWTDAAAAFSKTAMLKGANRLRRSLVPSLLDVRRINESLSNAEIEIFEIAGIYLADNGDLPREQWTLSAISERGFSLLKGVVENLIASICPNSQLEAIDTEQALLEPGKQCELRLNDQRLGFLGDVATAGMKQFGLRRNASILEIDLSLIASSAELIPQHVRQSPYPSISRDLNPILDEGVRWSQIASTVREVAGDYLETLQYQEIYRDPKKDGAGKKRLLFSITLRSQERTLTGEEADQIRINLEAALQKEFAAAFLA